LSLREDSRQQKGKFRSLSPPLPKRPTRLIFCFFETLPHYGAFRPWPSISHPSFFPLQSVSLIMARCCGKTIGHPSPPLPPIANPAKYSLAVMTELIRTPPFLSRTRLSNSFSVQLDQIRCAGLRTPPLAPSRCSLSDNLFGPSPQHPYPKSPSFSLACLLTLPWNDVLFSLLATRWGSHQKPPKPQHSPFSTRPVVRTFFSLLPQRVFGPVPAKRKITGTRLKRPSFSFWQAMPRLRRLGLLSPQPSLPSPPHPTLFHARCFLPLGVKLLD